MLFRSSLLGITSTPLQLISEWMLGGDLTEYIKKHPSANRLGLVGISTPILDMHLPSRKLHDITEGLQYLHSHDVVHGDLKGVRERPIFRFTTGLTPSQTNVLVDTTGHARITDFGFATVTQNLDSIQRVLGGQGHAARWTAPEILHERGTYSKEADIFSFAMVMIEVRYRSLLCANP